MPWLFNEDEALKEKFKGLTVADVNAPPTGRPVQVKFSLPETEISTVEIPMLVIRHGSISEDTARAHRGRIQLPYSPEGADPVTIVNGSYSPNTKIWSEFPIPYNLDYTITTYARTAVHSLELTGKLAAIERIPARFGYLEIPQDGTIRRMDLLLGPESEDERDAEGKRLFKKIYAVRVSSELLPSEVARHVDVTSIDLDLATLSDVYDV